MTEDMDDFLRTGALLSAETNWVDIAFAPLDSRPMLLRYAVKVKLADFWWAENGHWMGDDYVAVLCFRWKEYDGWTKIHYDFLPAQQPVYLSTHMVHDDRINAYQSREGLGAILPIGKPKISKLPYDFAPTSFMIPRNLNPQLTHS